MLKTLVYLQVCDAAGCERERLIRPDIVNSDGWQRRNDIPGHPVDVCPDHTDIKSSTIIFGEEGTTHV
jgi:hypothetical protein